MFARVGVVAWARNQPRSLCRICYLCRHRHTAEESQTADRMTIIHLALNAQRRALSGRWGVGAETRTRESTTTAPDGLTMTGLQSISAISG
jgi:hypothetical protein